MRFGLVGTGYWARQTHGAALSAHPDVELVGVWGRSFDKAEDLAQVLGARAYRDADDLFADVDAVAFAVPPDVQAELAARAAARGCHLLLDKPIAFTVGAADALVGAVSAADVRSIVFFTSRFVTSTADWLAAQVSADTWQSARLQMLTSIFEPGNPFADSPWRRERGALWDIGPHALSVALPMLGPVTGVVAVRGVEDAVEVALRHRSHAMSVLSLSLTAPTGSQGEEIRFYGVAGQTAPPPASETQLEAMTACVSALIAAVQSGTDPACDVRFGREVVAILVAAQAFLDRGDADGPAMVE